MSEKKNKGSSKRTGELATPLATNKKAKTRGAKYTAGEINELLNLVEQYLPTGGDEWDGTFFVSLIKSYIFNHGTDFLIP